MIYNSDLRLVSYE